jgi:hypothetical protein
MEIPLMSERLNECELINIILFLPIVYVYYVYCKQFLLPPSPR